MTLIDISVPLHNNMSLWPNSPGFRLEWVRRIATDTVSNNSMMHCDMHAGTHIDAPLHFVEDGAPVEAIALERLIGPCVVVSLGVERDITAHDLDALHLPADTRRLLLKTRNSTYWAQAEQTFQPDFVALSLDAAQWLVAHHIDVIGVDYHSVQHYQGDPRIHQVLLQAGCVIIECLDLSHVRPGPYELICLPLKISGAEAAPARVLLRSQA